MAIQQIKPINDALVNAQKWNNLSVKNTTGSGQFKYHELTAKLTHNFISQMQIFDEDYAAKFAFIDRGSFTKALGEGLRFIQTYGTLEVKEFTVVNGGDQLSLVAPYELMERCETLGNWYRLQCSARMPDIMASHEQWVNPQEMVAFQREKIGTVQKSLALYTLLTWHYILCYDPYHKNQAPFLESHGMTTWLTTSFDDNEIIGKMLKLISEKIAKEIEKEKNIKNIFVYDAMEWSPRKLTDKEAKAEYKRLKAASEHNKLDANKMKTVVKGVKDIDPVLSMCSIARLILAHARQMLKFSAMNASDFPGNDKDGFTQYGKAKDKIKYMCKTTKEDLVILMSDRLYAALESFADLPDVNPNVTFTSMISKLINGGWNIIPIEGMPINCIKLASRYRYNQWLLYSKNLPDTMGYRDFRMWTLHQGILIGIRQFPPCCVVNINNFYVDPITEELIFGYKERKENFAAAAA